MKITCEVLTAKDLADVRKELIQIRQLVETAAGTLAQRIRTHARRKTGDLISGIIPSPWEENSKYPGKIVRQVYFDADMNDTFVKVTKSGKRYYYPASQEFGFRIANRTQTFSKRYGAHSKTKGGKRVPGKFFMQDTFIDYVPAFNQDVDNLIKKVVSK